MSLVRICLVMLLLLGPAQSGAAIVELPGQQKQKPKFVPAPPPTDHYALPSRQAWTL